MDTNVLEIQVKEPIIDWDLKLLDHPQSKYTPEQKIAVMTNYFVYGNLEKASRYANVPYDIVRDWHTRSAWWATEFDKIRTAKQEELDSTFTTILHDCMADLKKRLKEGDMVLDKNNELRAIPVKAKDLAVIGGVLFDKRQLLRGNATKISQSTSSLSDLEEKFKQFSAKLTQGK
jgi:hypothetical protein